MIKKYEKLSGYEFPKENLLAMEGMKILNKPTSKNIAFSEKTLGGITYFQIKVMPNSEETIHMCFGSMQKRFEQRIRLKLFIGERSSVKLYSHCIFPNSKSAIHEMLASVFLEENSELEILEMHIHSEKGAEIISKIRAHLNRNARFYDEFKMVRGAIGKLLIDYKTFQKEFSSAELSTKIYAKANDEANIKEILNLLGNSSRGIAKSRIFLSGNSRARVYSEARGSAKNVFGHIDCHEILSGNARAYMIPKVVLEEPSGRITHEAAIGKLEKKEIETLMSRGLTEKEAIDFIVKGFLR